MDRKILSYIFVPVVQRECNIFARGWNSHRIRHQPGLMLPTGKPDYMFSFPEKCTGFDAEDRHINVTEEALIEVGNKIYKMPGSKDKWKNVLPMEPEII